MPPRERRLEDALAGSLSAPPAPADGRALVEYAGGRRALTEQLSGMPGPPRRASYSTPAEYETARRRWRAASQSALRYDKGARTPTVPRETRSRIRRAATAAKRVLIAERGLRARMMAEVTVPSTGVGHQDTRTRVMPSGGPGVLIPGSVVRRILAQLGPDREAAAEDFIEAFWDAYGMPESAVVVRVVWIKVWPDGTREPA